jgi:glycosyltransferase involved in cell wall biosynthesis
LRALAFQNYPRDRFEVLAVDDGSGTSPKAAVNAFLGQLNVRLLAQLHSGPAAARNYGARHAIRTLRAFTDDDCTPSASWLETLATRFVSFPDYALGGRTINGVPNNPYSTASQLVVDYLCAHWNSDSKRATFLTCNILALPAERFHTLGGFDAAWNRAAGEDRELCDRWISRGYRMMYVPDVLRTAFGLRK